MSSRLKKRKRNDPPDKWRSAEDHGETMEYMKAKEHSIWKVERELADAIIESLRRNGVDDVFQLDKLTKGMGNCFMIATMQQLRREEAYEKSRPEVKEIADRMNHKFFRKNVSDWVMQNLTHPKIVKMREMYNLDQGIKKDLGEETKTWDEYWNHMLKDGIWADNWFVQVTALFLRMDFWIMDTKCTKKKPYFQVDGNLEEDEYCNETLYLGLAHELHYQSLLLADIEDAKERKDGDESKEKVENKEDREIKDEKEMRNEEENEDEGERSGEEELQDEEIQDKDYEDDEDVEDERSQDEMSNDEIENNICPVCKKTNEESVIAY